MSDVFVWKGIKPGRWEDKEFERELRRELQAVAKDIKRDFRATVRYWKHKPRLRLMTDPGDWSPRGSVSGLVGTDDAIYSYVDKGTRPHVIKPRRAKRLRFRTGYRAKTTPGVLISRRGGATGDVVFARKVNHPGTEARGFSEELQRQWSRRFKARIQRAMNRAREAAGRE